MINVEPTSQYSGKVQTTFGVEINREAISIATIVPGEGGKLKIMKIEEFVDSKTDSECAQKIGEAMAKAAGGK